ncbi:hypothetical protein CAEBREN_00437 [Caenorhabditis brenneri]|uniref:Uncharacterized protein n=1 Tax=Caenorhabditis brenneri TaxID=135651 RepID=G0NB82_CAEBE|nr:hypothetical protein CAEBREN_00437 [Caenorhabditis brenneri]
MEVEKSSGTEPDPATWRGELYPAIRELEQQFIQENMVKAAQQPVNVLMPPVANLVLSNAQDDAAGPLGIGFAPQHIAFVPERQQEEAGIQNQRHTNVAQGMLPPNLIAPATNGIQVGPMLSPVELARTFLLSGKISRLLRNHQYGSLTGTPRSSRSKTHSSPPKAPKRPRDRKRDAETKGKVTDASDKTPIKLVSPDDKEMQLTTAVELRYISTPSTNMCHTYSTSTFSTQLPPQLNSPSTRKCHVGHPAALQDLELQGQ